MRTVEMSDADWEAAHVGAVEAVVRRCPRSLIIKVFTWLSGKLTKLSLNFSMKLRDLAAPVAQVKGTAILERGLFFSSLYSLQNQETAQDYLLMGQMVKKHQRQKKKRPYNTNHRLKTRCIRPRKHVEGSRQRVYVHFPRSSTGMVRGAQDLGITRILVAGGNPA